MAQIASSTISWHCAKDKALRLFAQRWSVLLVDVDVDVVSVLVDDVGEVDDVEVNDVDVDVELDVLVDVDVVLVVVSHSAQVLAH